MKKKEEARAERDAKLASHGIDLNKLSQRLEITRKALKDVEKSLRENLTLLHKGNLDSFLWATYEEIKVFLAEGYEIFNDEKRELYGR